MHGRVGRERARQRAWLLPETSTRSSWWTECSWLDLRSSESSITSMHSSKPAFSSGVTASWSFCTQTQSKIYGTTYLLSEMTHSFQKLDGKINPVMGQIWRECGGLVPPKLM